jgi:pyruvate dehydrogenase (quinone)
MIGLKGIFIDDPEQLGEAWEEALSADRPTVVEVKTDREIAPLPPHISLAQAKAFMSSVAREKTAGHTIRDTVRQAFSSIFEKAD